MLILIGFVSHQGTKGGRLWFSGTAKPKPRKKGTHFLCRLACVCVFVFQRPRYLDRGLASKRKQPVFVLHVSVFDFGCVSLTVCAVVFPEANQTEPKACMYVNIRLLWTPNVDKSHLADCKFRPKLYGLCSGAKRKKLIDSIFLRSRTNTTNKRPTVAVGSFSFRAEKLKRTY